MTDDLCPGIAASTIDKPLNYFFESNLTGINCTNFVSGTFNQGLHVVFVRYFETLRNMLN